MLKKINNKGIKILSIVGVMLVAAALLATLAIGWTDEASNTIPESGTRYVVSTGSVSSIDGIGILDDSGTEFYEADLNEDLSKVGLDVVYAGFVTDGKISIDYIEPVYFDYTNDITHIKGVSKSSPIIWEG